MKKSIEQDFLEDVKDHEIHTLLDDGLYRHLRCKEKDSYIYGFDIITWPGYLAMTGDMGTWVFSRTQDMFSFFVHPNAADGLKINAGYWSEKLHAVDCQGRNSSGAMEFSEEIFKRTIKDRFDSWVQDNEPTEDDQKPDFAEKRERIWAEIEDNVLTAETEESAHRAARDFDCDGFEFTDFWEADLRDYKRGFIWALYAIVWAIRQYNAAKYPNLNIKSHINY